MDIFELAVTNGDTLVVENRRKKMRYEFVTLNKTKEKQRRICRLYTAEGTVQENPWNQPCIEGTANLVANMVALNPQWTVKVEPKTVEATHETWTCGGRGSNKSVINRLSADMSGKVVCITGGIKDLGLTRRQASSALQKAGATVVETVTKKVDYVLVGGLADNRWKYKDFGNKTAKAIELQDLGHSIEILDAEATLRSLECRI